jgi:hypothetical protein
MGSTCFVEFVNSNAPKMFFLFLQGNVRARLVRHFSPVNMVSLTFGFCQFSNY